MTERRSRSDGVYVAMQRRGVLALPADIRRRHRLDEPGAQVLITDRGDGVLELRAQLPVQADQQWFWSAKWQAMEAEAEKQIAAGESTTHDSADALFAHLDEQREQH